MKKVLAFSLLAILVLAGVVVVRTLLARPHAASVAPAEKVAVPAEAAQRLAAAIRLRTISPDNPRDFDPQPFANFRDYLVQAYPAVHSRLTREVVNDNSLLYTWRGSDDKLAPLLLMAHYDVVPVEPGTEDKWAHAAFSGEAADGAVWGRGSMDDKGSVTAILEAVEMLLRSGYQPKRTVLLAFGHDEERGGRQGAQQIVAVLKQRNVRPEFVLDEGGAIMMGVVPGLTKPLAVICTGEKGYVSVELTAAAPAGHSSTPPPQTAIGIVAAAVAKLEKQQMPLRLVKPMRDFFESLAPEMPFGRRLVMSNLWLFQPLAARAMAASPMTAATVRTTTAPTIISAGSKENVLPSSARAVLNFRILPGDTVDSVLEHMRRVVDDPRVSLRAIGDYAGDPPPISPTDSDGYRMVERTTHQIFPEAVVTSSLTLGATDSRYYSALTPNVYRFSPYRVDPAVLHQIHGTDEHLGLAQFENAIRFYRQLVLNATR